MAAPAPIQGPAEFAASFGVSRETIARLETYAALLNQWQKTINLVAPKSLADVWHRHFADSAQIYRLAPTGARTWLDLGSGAGFPGLVVAILAAEHGAGDTSSPDLRSGPPGRMGRRDLAVTLLESDSRKAAFLREVARQTGVTVDIVCARIESPATHDKVGRSDVVSARALAPLGRLLEWACPYFTNDSIGLFLKGREVEAEIAAAEESFAFRFRLEPSLTDPEGRVVVVRNLRVKSEG